MTLDDIIPVDGVQDYLHARGIPQEELDYKRDAPCPPGVYYDHTYDWVAGFAQFVQPATVLEIGVYRGYSLAAFLKGAAGSISMVVGVDNGSDPCGNPAEAIEELRQEYPWVAFAYLQIDSQKDWEQVPKGPFDLVHIDADHSYEAARADLFHFGPLVSEHGIVVVHDTVDPQVKQAAMEFAYQHRMETREIPTSNGNIVMRRKQP